MTTDLAMLAASAGLHWLIIMAAAGPKLLKRGLVWGLGNRHEAPEDMPDWVARADRCAANMLENLPIFAALVLVVHAAGLANETTATGALVFFFARVGHTVLYLGGVPYLRTAAWAVSVVGMFMVASPLFGQL